MSYKKITKLLIWLVIIIAISLQFAIKVNENRDKFFTRNYHLQYTSLKNLYYSSQYVKKNATFIPDEAFESFAAGAFLKGLNPILIVHDHPPLGRYFLSLSILLFDNQSTLIPFFLLAAALAVFLLGKLMLKENLYALIPVAVFMNEPLVINKLMYTPLPEPIQLPFILFAIYFFILAIRSKKKILLYAIVSILLGVVISTRFFVTGVAMLGSMMIYLLFFKKNIQEAVIFALTLPLSIIVLLLSYTKTIQDGSSIIHIFGIQKYILAYHKSAFVHSFSFWDLILFDRWHTWWGKESIITDAQWIIAWPISVISSGILLGGALMRKFKITEPEKIVFLWVIVYSLTLSAGYTSTRYFLPLLPFFYILTTSLFIKLFSNHFYVKKNIKK